MSQEIIDLDAAGLFAPPIRVRLGGVEYDMPGDIPAPLYVQMSAVMAVDAKTLDAQAQQQLALELHDELLELFRQYQPDIKRLPLPLRSMTAAINYIYGGGAQQGGGDPTPAPSTKRVTRSSKRPTGRARSRRSRSST